MADVLVGKVGDAHDGTLLDGQSHLLIVVDTNHTNLVALFLELLLDNGRVVGNLLDHEGRTDDIDDMTGIVP